MDPTNLNGINEKALVSKSQKKSKITLNVSDKKKEARARAEIFQNPSIDTDKSDKKIVTDSMTLRKIQELNREIMQNVSSLYNSSVTDDITTYRKNLNEIINDSSIDLEVGNYSKNFNKNGKDFNIESFVCGKDDKFWGATSIVSRNEKGKSGIDIEKEGDAYHINFIRPEILKENTHQKNEYLEGGYAKVTIDEKTGKRMLTIYENESLDSKIVSREIDSGKSINDVMAEFASEIAKHRFLK